jgi:hypothetical protein
MSEKIKDKIEKLLNLSMSDNEHEASLALSKALKLMNEHNITEDEVHRQNFISKDLDIGNLYRVPSWVVELHSSMANVSGCIFTWKNGYKSQFKENDLKAKGTITGRERDVLNAVYLIDFLKREVENKSNEQKRLLKEKGAKGASLSSYIKGFKSGIIKIVFVKIWEQQNTFFNEQDEAGLVCINLETKIQESEDSLKGKFREHKSKSKTDTRAEAAGILAGKDIEINQAVSGQDEIKRLGA